MDFDNLEFTKGWGLREIEIIKRPTKRKVNGKNQKWIDWVLREMPSWLTLNSIKYNPWFYPVGKARALTKVNRPRLTDQG